MNIPLVWAFAAIAVIYTILLSGEWRAMEKQPSERRARIAVLEAACDELKAQRDFLARKDGEQASRVWALADERDRLRGEEANLRDSLEEAREYGDRWRAKANDIGAERDRYKAALEEAGTWFSKNSYYAEALRVQTALEKD